MTINNIVIHRSLEPKDLDEITNSFRKIRWHKPRSLFESYLSDQASSIRTVLVAKINDQFCGYVTIKWKSDYLFFNQNNIPEISDLNVLPSFQKQGIGTQLINTCATIAKDKDFKNIGLGVGLTADYGSAQKLYVQLGFVPDGNGIHYNNKAIKYSEQVIVDDDLVLFFSKKL